MPKINKSLIHPDEIFDSKIPMLCFAGCGKETTNRVKTDLDIGLELGEEKQLFWAPICNECLKENE